MKRLGWAVLSAALLTPAAAATAGAQNSFVAHLTTTAEPHPVVPTLDDLVTPRPTPFGFATFTLNATGLHMVATVHNIDVTGTQTPQLTDNLLAAHIHAPINPETNTGGVVWGFFGNPCNDLPLPCEAPGLLTPFATGVGGTFETTWNFDEGNNTTLTEQLANIRSENSYINFHTVQHPGGEIRGTLQVVPEPATVLLLGSGLAGLGLMGWRRRVRVA